MSETQKDCLSCKIISICCCVGIGGYLISVGRQPTQRNKFSLIFLGLGSVGLGLSQLFDKPTTNTVKR